MHDHHRIYSDKINEFNGIDLLYFSKLNRALWAWHESQFISPISIDCINNWYSHMSHAMSHLINNKKTINMCNYLFEYKSPYTFSWSRSKAADFHNFFDDILETFTTCHAPISQSFCRRKAEFPSDLEQFKRVSKSDIS